MSEYLSKKAVLEFIKSRKAKFAGSYKDIEYGAYLELETIETHIESGAVDADNTEIQRLRATAIKLHETINSFWQGDCDKSAVVNAQSNLCDILSTTTEPTAAERVIGLRAWDKELEMFHDEVVAIDFRLGRIRVFSKSEDDYPSDWLPLERFVLYGINATEGDGNDA